MISHDFAGNRWLRWIPHPATAAIGAIGFFFFVHYMDSRWAYMPYVFAVTLTLAALIFLLSRRAYFSLYAAGIFSVLQALASKVKFELNGMALHVYDLIFTAGDGSLLSFLLESYLSVLVTAALLVMASVALLWLVFRLERPMRLNWLMRGAMVPVALALCFTAFPRAKTHDSEYLPFTGGYNASALYFSLSHIPYLVMPSPLSARLDRVEIDKPFEDTVQCGPDDKKSDFFLVLAESQAPPTMFPKINAPAGVEQYFRSGDGKLRPLNVETFGAGTWMTNFSVLTGLSTADFGWQAPYVNKFMQGGIRGALPEMLSRCGYRTIALMSLKYHSINEGPFLDSLGFDEIYDADAMDLGGYGVRDKAYFEFAEKLITEHRRTDKRPLFIAIQTMFSHGPFHAALVAEDELPPKRYSSDPEIDEYMRRVLAARTDFAGFLAGRSRDPGARGTVVAEFGDHQATATRHFVDAANLGSSETTNFASRMYETFFAVHVFGRELDFRRLGQKVDAAFLSARVLAAADLPTSPVFSDLARLSDACNGRFHLCAARMEIDRHLKKRMEAGLLAVN